MKLLKTLLITLSTVGIIFLSLSCSGNSDTDTPAKPTISTVQRGNLSVTVTGTGNLALEYKQGLSFGQTGLVSQASNAKISEVLVRPGDTVKQGEVLVKADTSDLEDTLEQDQHNLDQAKSDLLNAQNNLITDQLRLSQQSDVQAIQTKIDNEQTLLLNAQAMRQQAMVSTSPYASDEVNYWNQSIEQHQSNITKYQKDMDDFLSDPQHYLASSVNGSAASVAAIKNLQMQIEQDKSTITLRQNAVDEAQTRLDNDKNQPQEITAPFDGLITKVNINPGDIKSRSDDLIEIAQPDKFIANIMVTERDVMSLEIGKAAAVSFDAISGSIFPAKITQISPLATIQQGVVNYDVTVELTSTTPIAGANDLPAQLWMKEGPTSFSDKPEGFPPAEMNEQAVITSPSSEVNSMKTLPEGNYKANDVILKDGLSATVDIVIEEKENVLMVPYRAITGQGYVSIVEKVTGSGTEQVTVQTGITDGINTEIISGLNEGDQVMVQNRSTSSSSSNLMMREGIMIR